LRRSTLYNYYLFHCTEQRIEPVNPASFGKLIRSVFLGLRTRRLGTRGNSKYHYYGIRVKISSPLNQIGEDNAIAFKHPLSLSPTGSPGPHSPQNNTNNSASSLLTQVTASNNNSNNSHHQNHHQASGATPNKRVKSSNSHHFDSTSSSLTSSSSSTVGGQPLNDYKPILTTVNNTGGQENSILNSQIVQAQVHQHSSGTGAPLTTVVLSNGSNKQAITKIVKTTDNKLGNHQQQHHHNHNQPPIQQQQIHVPPQQQPQQQHQQLPPTQQQNQQPQTMIHSQHNQNQHQQSLSQPQPQQHHNLPANDLGSKLENQNQSLNNNNQLHQQQQQQIQHQQTITPVAAAVMDESQVSLAIQMPDFGSISTDNLQLPGDCTLEDVKRFEEMYKKHCEKILDLVVALKLDLIKSLWSTFWRSPEIAKSEPAAAYYEELLSSGKFFSLCQVSQVIEFVKLCDFQFYQFCIEILIPDVFGLLPHTLVTLIRNLSKSIESWLRNALTNVPEEMRQMKIVIIKAFSMTLRRYTSLSHLIQTVKNSLQNETLLIHMSQDINKVDFNYIKEQLKWTCACDESIVGQFEVDFKESLKNHESKSMENWLAWIDSLATTYMSLHEGQESFEKMAKHFMLTWSFLW
jgi:hypothetical protein